MTESKLRAWNAVENKMYYNVGINPYAKDYFVFDENGAIHDAYGVAPILIWPTGLQDKNGKEGYAGDLVKMFDRSLFSIVWNECYARFQLDLVKGDELNKVHSMDMLQFSEIVGNIYENPELMRSE